MPKIDLNDIPTRIITAIVIGLVFVGGWWLIARSSMNGEPPAQDEMGNVSESGTGTESGSVLGPIAENTPIITGSNEEIDVQDQEAGMRVLVANATFAQMSWIAVRDASGRTLGAGRFDAGTHTDIEVPLLRSTEAGQSYQVLIYVDDGNREFDLHGDILVTRGDGSVVGDVFSAR